MYHDDLESQKENSIKFEAERALGGLDSWWGPACSILLKIHDAALMRKLGLTQPLGRAASYDFAWAKLEQEKMELAWNFATELGGSLSWSQLLYKYAFPHGLAVLASDRDGHAEVHGVVRSQGSSRHPR